MNRDKASTRARSAMTLLFFALNPSPKIAVLTLGLAFFMVIIFKCYELCFCGPAGELNKNFFLVLNKLSTLTKMQDFNPARLGITRSQPEEECAVTRGRSRYYREPPAPAEGSSTPLSLKQWNFYF